MPHHFLDDGLPRIRTSGAVQCAHVGWRPRHALLHFSVSDCACGAGRSIHCGASSLVWAALMTRALTPPSHIQVLGEYLQVVVSSKLREPRASNVRPPSQCVVCRNFLTVCMRCFPGGVHCDGARCDIDFFYLCFDAGVDARRASRRSSDGRRYVWALSSASSLPCANMVVCQARA